jgi:hypothetical protein
MSRAGEHRQTIGPKIHINVSRIATISGARRGINAWVGPAEVADHAVKMKVLSKCAAGEQARSNDCDSQSPVHSMAPIPCHDNSMSMSRRTCAISTIRIGGGQGAANIEFMTIELSFGTS